MNLFEDNSNLNIAVNNLLPKHLEMFSGLGQQHLEIAAELEESFNQILEHSSANMFDRKLAKRSEETAVQKVYQVSDLKLQLEILNCKARMV
jgi:hypothetical protein